MKQEVQTFDPTDQAFVARAYLINAVRNIENAQAANIIIHGTDDDYYQLIARKRRMNFLHDMYTDLCREDAA